MLRPAAVAFALASVLQPGANATDLTIRIKGARDASGSVVAALYGSKPAFPKDGQQYAGFRTKAATGGASVTFHDLPPGDYAVTAFHDENNNGKLEIGRAHV